MQIDLLVNRLRPVGGRARRYVHRRRNAFARAWHEERDREHLVPDPVFILCSVRSGSTLLRSILDTHTQICAPHELHLNTMRVSTARDYARNAWRVAGFSVEDLENVLWDRAMHKFLVRTSKRLFVDKTPQNAAIWPRINAYWPHARYIHLRRHPAAILDSLVRAEPGKSLDAQAAWVLKYCGQLDEARAALPGPTVRYEDLTRDPAAVTKQICDYLGVRAQPRMLRYKRDSFQAGLGDWSSKIKSGRIQPAAPVPPPEEIPEVLREQARAWGYLADRS